MRNSSQPGLDASIHKLPRETVRKVPIGSKRAPSVAGKWANNTVLGPRGPTNVSSRRHPSPFSDSLRGGLLGNLEADGACMRFPTSYMRLVLLRAKCYDACEV